MPKHAQRLPEHSHAIPSKTQREDLAFSDRARPPAAGAILQRVALAPQSLRPADILRLQQTLGNRGVAQILSQSSAVRSLVQAKLTVNAPGDKYEQEADRLAEEVMQKPAGQRAESENEDEEEDEGETPAVMTKRHPSPAAGGAFEAGEAFEQQLQAARGQGQPLPSALRQDFETKLGADFRQVRVHTDARADQLNRSIQAVAFATGRDLFFQREAYDPDSYDGQKLIAHELTHVLQQRAGGGTALASLQRNSHDKAPKITSETTFAAPDGTANTRTEVGVGEEVTFTGSAPGKWTASDGLPKSRSGKTFHWTAPSRAQDVEIKLGPEEDLSFLDSLWDAPDNAQDVANKPEVGSELESKSAPLMMTVLEPASIQAVKKNEYSFKPGTAGAGMTLTFNFYPKNVSFGNVESKEVPGPASNITGYYKKHNERKLCHDASNKFFPIQENNEGEATDVAKSPVEDQPYSNGSFDWVIPNNFRVQDEEYYMGGEDMGGDGKQYTTVTQTFSINAFGTVKITKAGASVEREVEDS